MLSGNQKDFLLLAFNEAFSLEDLKKLTFSLNIDLENIAGENSPKDSVTRNLILWAERHGRTLELVKAASEDRPNSDHLKEFASVLEQHYVPDDPTQISTIQQTLPKMEDIFEIIKKQEEVLSAIFGTEPNQKVTPFINKYIGEREGVDNVQEGLSRALLEAGGLLLVRSRAGLGKTREIAELAKKYSTEGWIVCVAKNETEANKALNHLENFPHELEGKRLLLVFDDLDKRIESSDAKMGKPYAERFTALLNNFEEPIELLRLRVLATAKYEDQDQDKLEKWGFGIYDLPEFTTDSLERMLRDMANKRRVNWIQTATSQMVDNSDKTPRTLRANVERAKENNGRLTLDNWRPLTEGLWGELFLGARGRYPATGNIYKAIYLLREAGVVTRSPFVAQLGARLGEYSLADTQSTVDYLVKIGLLKRRNDILNTFSDIQLDEGLEIDKDQKPKLVDYWDQVVESVIGIKVSSGPTKDLWLQDLVTLSERLVAVDRYDDALTVADLAINRGRNSADVYYIRGLAHLAAKNFADAEFDFGNAIDRGQDNAEFYLQRSMARHNLGDKPGFVKDFERFIKHDQNNDQGSGFAAFLRRQFGNIWTGAGRQANAIIQQSNLNDQPQIFFLRGMFRLTNKEYGGAEKDFKEAIKLGQNDAETHSYLGLSYFSQGHWQKAAESYKEAVILDDARIQDWISLAAAAKKAGNDADWKKAIEKAQTFMDESDPYIAARFSSVKGDTVEALNFLFEALKGNPALADWAKEDPALYLVREKPQFAMY